MTTNISNATTNKFNLIFPLLPFESTFSNQNKFNPEVYIVNLGVKARALAFTIAEELRDLDVNTLLNIE
jgi:hypothetical protein